MTTNGPHPTFGHGKVCYLVIPTRDAARSAGFYQSVFRWTLREGEHGMPAFDDGVGEVSGTWVLSSLPVTDGGIEVHLMVEDLFLAVASIRASGGTVDKEDIHIEDQRWARFRDPDDNLLGLYEHPLG